MSAMTPERWRAVEAILRGALDTADAAARAAFVTQACDGDTELRREVESLLAAHDRHGDFLERPAAEVFAGDAIPATLTQRLGKALAGRYTIDCEIGRGGMATVHRARDVRHGRVVAIKVLREELAAAVGADRFLEEIRVTASLHHPHILPLFDSGSGDGLLWYVMPLVEGETLRARLARERRLPLDEAVRLVREMADALEYAHRHGVVHRDVKPENVLLQGGHALVADFGIALALENAAGDRLTRTGITLGTPSYMAPEQAAGSNAIDARTDVYALGAVLHEMLAGESPFAASSQAEVFRKVMHEPVAALATRRADVPSQLDAAVRRALSKKPSDRFPSASAFSAALAESRELLAERPEPRVENHFPRTVSARAAMYAVGVVLVAGLAAGFAMARWPAASSLPGAVVDAVLPRVGSDAAWVQGGQGELTLSVVDRAGRSQRVISASRPWTPRFSPDGQHVAYGAFGSGRSSSDVWVTDIESGVTRRLTDDDNDSNDPQWSADGAQVAYSASAPGGKDLMLQPVADGAPGLLASRNGTQFASDWVRDESALLVTEDAGDNRRDIIVQPADGSAPWPYAATAADETAARVSPDGRWVAYTSDASGRPEVYLDSYPRPGRRVMISSGGGAHPVWRGDGRELYYWKDESLVAVSLERSGSEALPKMAAPTTLFRASYQLGLNTMYDVSPDGQRFVIILSGDRRGAN